jgi:hypothetical protein
MIGHLGSLRADQGFPSPGDRYATINHIDACHDQSHTGDFDGDSSFRESHSSMVQDACVLLSSSSDSSPESAIVSSGSSSGRVKVRLWKDKPFRTLVSTGCDSLPFVPEAVSDSIDRLVLTNTAPPVRQKCSIKKAAGPGARKDQAGRDHSQYECGSFDTVLTDNEEVIHQRHLSLVCANY